MKLKFTRLARKYLASALFGQLAFFVQLDSPIAQELHIRGAGSVSCGKYMNDGADDPQFAQWFYGYVTGVQYHTKWRSGPLPDFDTVKLWLRQYCSKNPTHFVVSGAVALVQEIGGPKASHPWIHP